MNSKESNRHFVPPILLRILQLIDARFTDNGALIRINSSIRTVMPYFDATSLSVLELLVSSLFKQGMTVSLFSIS